MGAGTTAVVAKKLGRNYLGIELNNSYIAIAQRRIDGITLNPLFDKI
jgi:DNA modification methylase